METMTYPPGYGPTMYDPAAPTRVLATLTLDSAERLRVDITHLLPPGTATVEAAHAAVLAYCRDGLSRSRVDEFVTAHGQVVVVSWRAVRTVAVQIG
jgi:hypothetical protein